MQEAQLAGMRIAPRLAWLPGHDRDASAATRLHGMRRLRDEHARLWRESAAARELSGSLISLAALVGTPVKDSSGATVARLRDVVVRWTAASAYPAVTAVVVRASRHDVVIGARWIEVSPPCTVRLVSAAAYARSAQRRQGEVALAHDVLDRQIVGADGVEALRPSDVYLASVDGRLELVGIEIGPRALLRRLGPRRLRGRIRPQRVIAWATVSSFTPALADSARSRGRRSDLAGRAGTEIELGVPGRQSHGLAPSEVRSALRQAQERAEGRPS